MALSDITNTAAIDLRRASPLRRMYVAWLISKRVGKLDNTMAKHARIIGKLQPRLINALDASPSHVSITTIERLARSSEAEQLAAAINLENGKQLGEAVASLQSEAGYARALQVGLHKILGDELMLERRNVGSVQTDGRTFHASAIKGAADYFGCFRGRHFELETKASNGKLRPEQVHFGKRCEAWGCKYIVAVAGRDTAETIAAQLTQ